MYPGHADQVLTAAISTEMGAYGLKTVIVVDEDIDPWDIPRVMYALSFRFQPNRSQVIKRGRVHAAGSLAAHQRQGNHRPAPAGCHHPL